MVCKPILLLLLCCLLSATGGYTQSVTGRNGIITGCVKDSASGRVLPMATVSVYRSADSMFIVALFSGNNGSFSLRSLPVDSVITLSVSYVGYRRYVKKIRLPAEQPQLKLGDVLLSDDSRLQDVVVTAEMPPLRMKGDTLEINPAAFNAGPNAVMEDVLKKVPGVVIWGDNKITVNGKVVIQLLVDGKPFFGEFYRGNAKFAA